MTAQTGRAKAFYLCEMIERGLEDIEDYYLAADVSEHCRNGTVAMARRRCIPPLR